MLILKSVVDLMFVCILRIPFRQADATPRKGNESNFFTWHNRTRTIDMIWVHWHDMSLGQMDKRQQNQLGSQLGRIWVKKVVSAFNAGTMAVLVKRYSHLETWDKNSIGWFSNWLSSPLPMSRHILWLELGTVSTKWVAYICNLQWTLTTVSNYSCR